MAENLQENLVQEEEQSTQETSINVGNPQPTAPEDWRHRFMFITCQKQGTSNKYKFMVKYLNESLQNCYLFMVMTVYAFVRIGQGKDFYKVIGPTVVLLGLLVTAEKRIRKAMTRLRLRRGIRKKVMGSAGTWSMIFQSMIFALFFLPVIYLFVYAVFGFDILQWKKGDIDRLAIVGFLLFFSLLSLIYGCPVVQYFKYRKAVKTLN
jgi:hypothetical protein